MENFRVFVPNNNITEREYIVGLFFDEFLGVKYEIVFHDNVSDWVIEFNNKTITFKDDFFGVHKDDFSYLKTENIPLKVEFVNNKYLVEDNIPVIYGNSTLKESRNEIFCGIDIFASSFFMLTRWEEYVVKSRDNHNRFIGDYSLAYKQNFLNRPIVNEYIGMLKNMMLSLDDSLIFKKYFFKQTITCDVDHIDKWGGMKIFRHLLGDLIQRKSILKFFQSLFFYLKVRVNLEKDPYDTFEFMMNVAEGIGEKMFFFFMGRGQTKFDNNYTSSSKKVSKIIKNIKKRGHFIGIHPTYNTYNNKSQFLVEKKELESNLKTKVCFGRQHYLRFDVPITWQIWEDNQMEWDSTCGYADYEGFRCGICYEYPLFNFLTRKKLNLRERPMVFMEAALRKQVGMSPEIMKNRILTLRNKVSRYNGDFVILWHNSSFNTVYWNKYNKIFKEVIFN